MAILGGAGAATRARAMALGAAMVLAALPLPAQTLAMRHFDNRDGLPQSQVSALLEDHLGFIWASTADGLVRLGPNEPQRYDSTNGFPAKDVSDLLEGPDGAIWVATQERGLTRILGREVVTFGPEQGLLEPNVHCLCQTAAGDLYVGTQQGVYRQRGSRFERLPLPAGWATKAITGLAADAQGRLWLGSRKGALARWDGARLEPATLPEPARSENILRLQRDPTGRLWALQSGHLLRLEAGDTWALAQLPGLPTSAVFTGLSFDPAGALLLSMGTDGLYQWDPGGAGRTLSPRELPCHDALNCALRDRHGGLWLGTDGDYLWAQPLMGLRNLVRDPDTGADLGLGTVTCFLARPGGAMLAGSNNGVFLWRPGRGLAQRWSRANGLASQDVWMLHDDGHGGAWIGTMKGLYHLAGGRILPGPPELGLVHILAMVRQGGRLWAGTDKGLAELGEDGRFLGLHDPAELVGYSAINCLLAEPDGLLVGTGQSLVRYRRGAFETAFQDDPTHAMQILALHQEAGGRLWVGTSQGLQVREPKTGRWSNLGLEANGTPIYAITWIRGLANGTVAIGHAKGVVLVNPGGGTFALTRRMGLLSDETNQDAALEDLEGRLWIGQVGGVSILDAREAFPAAVAPTPVVLDLTWERGSFWLPGRVTLPRGFANLSIHLDAGAPNTPFPMRYAVRQEEAGTWHDLDPGHASLYFEGLGAGLHRLRFRGSLNGADWREAKPLEVIILPAWYRTVWAEAALAALLGLGGFLALRLRTRHLERLNQALEARVAARTRALEGTALELARKNQSLEWTHAQLKDTLEARMLMINTVSHDLRSPLTSILLSMDQIEQAAQVASPKLQKALGIMGQEAHRLDGIVKGLLDRNRAESLVDRLQLQPASPLAILDKLEDTLTLKGEDRGLRTHLALEPDSLAAELLLDVTAMQQVLFNLVENALKFTDPPGDVGVRSSLEGAHWALEVWDTGRGIPRAECERLFNSYQQGQAQDAKRGWGLGLFICRSIVAAHGGTLEVDSDTGKGAIFKVLIPLRSVP